MNTSVLKISLIIWLVLQFHSYASTQENEENGCLLNGKQIIYSGPPIGIEADSLFKLGFSHIDVLSVKQPEIIPENKKYILWTGIAYAIKNSPWASQKSPYGNNLAAFFNVWQKRLEAYKKRYSKSGGKKKEGILVLDIEAKKSNNQLKINQINHEVVVSDFESYKKSMAWLYFQPLEFLKENYDHYEFISSYGDVPIERVWWEIPDRSWEEWINSPKVLNYVTHQEEFDGVYETRFARSLDFYAPSTYYFYSYENNDVRLAGRYLAYLLFQIEVNQAWSDKPIIPYQSFRFQGTKDKNSFVCEDIVRNSVVFSLISGADGIILHDDFKKDSAPAEYLNLLNVFNQEIELLSKFKSYFEGEIKYYKPDNARDLFVSRKPIVRGIENGNRLLVAACDPFQDKDISSILTIDFKGENFNVQIRGKSLTIEEIILPDN